MSTDKEKPETEPPAPAKVVTRTQNRRTLIVAIVAIVALAAISILVWTYWRARSDGAGRPVPTPRAMSTEQPTSPTTTEPTITIAPDVINRSGIKVEIVGEQLTSAGSGIVTTGIVQPNSYRTTPVVSLVPGIVRRVNVELGQNISKGQTVATIFSDELAMAQSRYLSALADLEEHHKHHARTMRLVEIGAASREELEQATTKFKTAEAELASQRQRLMLLGISGRRIDQLKTSAQVASEVALPAPVSGVVIGRSANPGEVVARDKELVRIADLSSVWVLGQVYEQDLGKVVVGSGATITSESYPGRTFRGAISYIDPTLDSATRTAQARIELANPGQALKIGMYVNVAFAALGVTQSTMPSIPKDAVQNVNNQQVVFVETKEANVFALRPVKVGPEANGRYQVIEGLTAGERIVTEGSFLLRAEWLKTNPVSHPH